jgi:adenylylsulfate kinase-like enzyme
MKNNFPILWLTGNTGAGKSTLAEGLEKFINEELDALHPLARRLIVLDGDDMRATISTDATLSAEDRRKHNLRVARLADHLRSRGFFVVVAVIAPFESVRKELDEICNPVWVYVKRSGLEKNDRPYEAPENPTLTIDHDELNIEDAQKYLRAFVERVAGLEKVAL